MIFAAILALATTSAQPQTPLPFLHARDVILFQGDSITDGGRWRIGQDYNHIMGQDYAYILAAKLGAELSGRDLTFINRGVGGEGVPQLAFRWKSDTLDLKPDVLSILVGINDTFFPGPKGETIEEYEHSYDQLLEETITALPRTKIVLGEPFLLPVGKYSTNYRSQLALVKLHQDVVRRLGQKYHLPVIHYQAAFDEAMKHAPANHWSWDGVHPTYAGHWLMVQEWLKTTSQAWSE